MVRWVLLTFRVFVPRPLALIFFAPRRGMTLVCTIFEPEKRGGLRAIPTKFLFSFFNGAWSLPKDP